MKRTFVIAASILTLVIIWYCLGDKEESQKRDQPIGGKPPVGSESDVPSNVPPGPPLTREELQALAVTTEELKIMFDAPVEFYGRVLDQHDEPVKDAEIRCPWPFMGPQQSARKLLTDADGRFEVKDLKAISIQIFVHPPEGYERLPGEDEKPRDYIQIAEPPDRIKRHEHYKAIAPGLKSQMFIAEAYKPDKTKPMIFRLNKLAK